MTRIKMLVFMFAVLSLSAGARADLAHCTYVQEARSATHEVCEMPVDEAKCAEIGQIQGNSQAEYSTGACPTNDLVGTCDKGATRILYYEGDPSRLEIGCGHQGGTWMRP